MKEKRGTARNILIVSEESRRAMRRWPKELRAIFDPDTGRALAEEMAEKKRRDLDEHDFPGKVPF